jgi:uncharacterized hydrophobic protein (TIGR00271 family)
VADLLHIRVVASGSRSEDVIAFVEAHGATCHVVVQRDAARQPRGDMISFDVAREAGNDVIDELRMLGLQEHGAIIVFHTELAISATAELAHIEAPGDPEATVMWDEVAVALRNAVAVTFPFLAFFVVAAIIAAVGVMTDSPVLIVGAMVVGPEYGSLASVAFGLHRRDVGLVGQGAACFAVGAAAAVAAAALTALLVRAVDQVPERFTLGDRPMTDFITNPDVFTVLVAMAAAVAGMLALTQGRSGTLVGVLISVTTLPAIAEIGVGLAFTRRSEVLGALTQLGINLVCLVVVGVATLAVLRRATPHLRTSPRAAPFGHNPVDAIATSATPQARSVQDL